MTRASFKLYHEKRVNIDEDYNQVFARIQGGQNEGAEKFRAPNHTYISSSLFVVKVSGKLNHEKWKGIDEVSQSYTDTRRPKIESSETRSCAQTRICFIFSTIASVSDKLDH